jgi:hypothetical protein
MAEPQGLYLRPPHGERSFNGEKTALVKAREFGIEDQPLILCSGSYAYGELRLAKPKVITLKEFNERYKEHRVPSRDRRKWWPDATELYFYAYDEWKPFDLPRRVAVPAGVQTIMGDVKFLDEEVNQMGQDINVNFNMGPGTEEKADAPCSDCPQDCPDGNEEDCKEETKVTNNYHLIANSNAVSKEDFEALKAIAEDRKIWTSADATDHTEAADTPKKKQQWASTANGVLKDCIDAVDGTATDAQRKACEGKAVRIANAAVKGLDEKDIHDMRTEKARDEMPLMDIHEAVWDALSPSSPDRVSSDDRPWPHEVKVYDTHVTYELEGRHFVRSYTIVDGKAQLGEAIEGMMVFVPTVVKELPVSDGESKAELVPESIEKGEAKVQAAKEEKVGVWDKIVATLQRLGGATELDFKGDAGFKTFDAEDGKTYIVTWTTNAFQDREGEIFTTEAIENYAAAAWQEIKRSGSKGMFDFWHVPGSEFGEITVVGVEGVC